MVTHEKVIHLIAGGPKHLIPDSAFSNIGNIEWMGVDRGVSYLLEEGIIPHFAVGDFDSVTDEEWTEITLHIDEISRFRAEKDETDMELAMEWALKQNPTKIKIFGATGGRLDHFMANALMLSHYQKQNVLVKIEMLDLQNAISIYFPGRYQIQTDIQKKYISFIPLTTDVTGLTLTGFKYPLTNHRVPFGSSLCISNELLLETGTFLFENGILMMIRSND
ncbi:thiamine diphosphokinase [Bacillus sp. FSL K6-3431]|uniref:thiamine diphosphokinase n=1 Tax=Bacillus sp. FSL K6-3431 TaxID=2921500 RepID=UPI0030FB0506